MSFVSVALSWPVLVQRARREDFRTGPFPGRPVTVAFMNANAPVGRYARIIMDDWFKRSFGTESRKRLLELFLRELIPEHDIVQLTYVSQEHVNPFPGKKSVRIDVECTDRDGSRFVVEMQVSAQESFYDRAVYYSSFAVQQQLAAGKDADNVLKRGPDSYAFPTVYFIGLMDFSFHEGSDKVLYRYTIREQNSNELMTPHLQYLFLELPNCRKALTPEATVLDNFCYALHNMEHLTDRPAELKAEIFKLLFDSAEIATFTPEEKVKYQEDMTTERDIRNQIAFAEQKGVERGREEGREEGERRALVRTARKMVRDLGYTVAQAAEATGLAPDAFAEE